MKRVPCIKQHDETDCGAACLASIAKYYGQTVPIPRLRQLAQTDKQGTTLLGLIRAAEQIGFSAQGVRGTPHNLQKASLPCIAHLTLERGMQHFVVLERIDAKSVVLMDPQQGERRTKARAEFEKEWSGVLLLLTYNGAPNDNHKAPSRLARLWNLIAGHRSALVQALVGALVYTLLGLALSVYVQQIVDTVLADGRAGPLNVMTLAMIVITIAQTIIGALRATMMLNIGQHVDARLILGYYNHLLRLPQGFFDRMRVGELTSRVTDAVKIRAFVGEVMVDAIANALIIAASAAMMLTYDWRLALWTFVLLPVYGALYAIGSHLSRRQQPALMQRGAALESQLVESLSAIGTIKRFGEEQSAAQKTEARFVQLFRMIGESARSSIWLGNTGTLVTRLGVIGLLWIGTTRALAQELSAGQLMSCYALFGFLTGPILSLVGFSRSLQEARAACERLFEIMELEPETQDLPLKVTCRESADVRFENVTFRYGGRGAALSNVSFTCPGGRVTALVGESGSGKSTIASLVQRLYPVEQGRILVGGQDIAHVDLASLRRVVGVVPQTIDLFAGTILENLVLSEQEPDVEQLVSLCDEIGLRDTIERMPHGWLTPVGERGVALSGGERQRLAIVRALYRRPGILIMDEATSALDWENEQRIVDAMHRAAALGTTVLVIAHRLTTIQSAAHVVVLQKGEVAEQGDHDTLLQARGAYARMWDHQHPGARRELVAGVA